MNLRGLTFSVTICLILLNGCGTGLPYKTQRIYEQSDGPTIYRLTGNKLKGSSILPKATLELNVQWSWYKGKMLDTKFSLMVRFTGEDWLSIEEGESLVLLVEGERFTFSGDGSSKHRSVMTGYIEELAWYDIDFDMFHDITGAGELKVKVIGSQSIIEREFSSTNSSHFSEFWNEFYLSWHWFEESSPFDKLSDRFSQVPSILEPDDGDVVWFFAKSKDELGSGGELQIYLDPQTHPEAKASFAKFTLGIGGALPMHKHEKTEEIAYILSGEGIVLYYENGEIQEIPISAGYVWYNPLAAWHSVRNTGIEPLTMVFVTIPNEKEGLLSFLRKIGVKPGEEATTLRPDEFGRIAAEHDLILKPTDSSK